MTYLLLLVLWGYVAPALRAQDEPAIHLQSIRQSSYRGQNAYGPTGDSAFLEFTMRSLLAGPQDAAFISNRDLLQSLCLAACDSHSVTLHDTIATNGQVVAVHLWQEPFVAAAHSYAYFEEDSSLIESIDGEPAYGAGDRLPTWQLDSLSIRWGKRSLKVPPAAWAGLYDPNFCDADLFRRPVAAYPALSGRYLYVYLYGGTGAGTYVAKLIFDQKRYLTRIIAEYPDLRRYEVFREDFIGF